jgi:hypothetical protein
MNLQGFRDALTGGRERLVQALKDYSDQSDLWDQEMIQQLQSATCDDHQLLVELLNIGFQEIQKDNDSLKWFMVIRMLAGYGLKIFRKNAIYYRGWLENLNALFELDEVIAGMETKDNMPRIMSITASLCLFHYLQAFTMVSTQDTEFEAIRELDRNYVQKATAADPTITVFPLCFIAANVMGIFMGSNFKNCSVPQLVNVIMYLNRFCINTSQSLIWIHMMNYLLAV